MAFPHTAFLMQPKLKCWFTYTPNFISLLYDSWQRFHFPSYPGTVPWDGFLSPAPCAESPFFALSRRYLSEGSFSCYLNRHYPVLITRTGSCARPNSSRRLRVNYYNGSLQVVTSPCWKMVLPDVISASLSLRAWTPIPVGSYGAFTRFFP